MKRSRFGVLVVLGLSLFAALALADSKPSVLYVGTGPAKGPPAIQLQYGKHPERLKQLYASRMPAFKALLEQHFDRVRVIDAADYTPKLSDQYDVTIFDALPPDLGLAAGRTNPRTSGPLRAYLPRDFSRAAIVIGENGYEIGAFIGLKINMHCPCLDAQAHGMKLDHEIFNTPVKVPLTIEQVKTPDNYLQYHTGDDLGPTMPMWRVQTEGYMEGKGMPVGLVSTGPGFEDSPDAEVISNGVNTKAVDSVAIARHGNFFMWGFWADPSYMTEEAKQVFVNAVYYIRKYQGQAPFVRADGYKLSRDFLTEHLSALSREDLRKSYEKELSFNIPNGPKTETDWIARRFSVPLDVAERIGLDGPALFKYHLSRVEYLREIPGKIMSTFEEDPDVKSLGISNRDVRLLDACIGMLERNDRVDMAKRILARYTDQKFTTAPQWRQWLEANRRKIFFTDLGGFRFQVYPTELDSAPAACASVKKQGVLQ